MQEGQTTRKHGRPGQAMLGQVRPRERLRGVGGLEEAKAWQGKRQQNTKPLALAAARGFGAIVDSGLLSHMTLCSIIGDGELNFRVRNGIGCTLSSMAINEICQNIN